MEYDPKRYITWFHHVGFSQADEALAAFISPLTGKQFGLNETDIYDAYLREYEHHRAMPPFVRYSSALQMQEWKKALAALQEMKLQYDVKLETPRCTFENAPNVFLFPTPTPVPG